jgi:hypothetical protein
MKHGLCSDCFEESSAFCGPGETKEKRLEILREKGLDVEIHERKKKIIYYPI